MKERLSGCRWLIAVAFLLVCTAPVSGQQAQQAAVPNRPAIPAPQIVRNEVLVRFRRGVVASQRAQFAAQLANAFPGRAPRAGIRPAVPDLDVQKIVLPDGVDPIQYARFLSTHPLIEFAHPNHLYHTCDFTPNDPKFATNMYGPQKISAPAAWDLCRGSKDVIVAMIDTGIDTTHADLIAQIAHDPANPANILGINLAPENINQPANSDVTDLHGHGTHTSGTVGASTNNGVGVVGIGFNVSLMPIKVFDPNILNNSATDEVVAHAITWAADHGARVISMSLGEQDDGTGEPAVMRNAMQYAWDKGCVLVAAAGNSATTVKSWPGADPVAIGVSATDSNDNYASFTNYGDWVWCAAPGVNIYSTTPGSYGYNSGTSMACPHVSGLAALLLSFNPSLTNAQVKDAIRNGTDKVGPETYDPTTGKALHYGYGRVNAFKTLVASGVGSVTARLLDRNRQPINGAEVHLYDLDSRAFAFPTATSAADGTATLPYVAPRRYHIGGYKAGCNQWIFSPYFQGWQVTAGQTTGPIEIVLDTTSALNAGVFGFVRYDDATGAHPIGSGVHIDVYSGGHLVASTDSDANGHYQVYGLNAIAGWWGWYTYIATWNGHKAVGVNFGTWGGVPIRMDIPFQL